MNWYLYIVNLYSFFTIYGQSLKGLTLRISKSSYYTSIEQLNLFVPLWSHFWWDHADLSIILYSIYTIKIERIEFFSSRLSPPYPSWRSHPEVWQKGAVTHFLIEGKWFHQNYNSFYTKHSSTHLLYPHITFIWHPLLSFAHAFIHNSRHYLFWKDNNWHHCFMEGPIICVTILIGRIIIDIIIYVRKRQMCIVFDRKVNAIMHSPIIHVIICFGKIIVDIIVLWKRKRKTCIIFERKINDIVAWWKKN